MPRITLITVAWNAAATIGDTMASVAAQGYDNHEHLVIDGASTDATVQIAQTLATPRTRIHSAPDKGLYDAMNMGLALAQGEYVGFLNADDFFVRTDALARIGSAVAADPDAVSAGIVIVRQDETSKWVRSYSASHFRPWMLRFGHMPPHPGFYARRNLFDRIGPFNCDYRIMADFDWILRFHLAGHRARAIPETLVALRQGGASNSGFESRRTIAREAHCALRSNGLRTALPMMWAKYGAKAAQFIVPPRQWPAPKPVAWLPRVDHAKNPQNSS